MEKDEKQWRCPYCDGLNDWQDQVCQICGDGTRPDRKDSRTESKRPNSEPVKAKVTESKKAEQWQEQSSQETVRAKTLERKQPEQESVRSKAPEVEQPKPGPAKAKEPEKKKHTGWMALGLAVVLAVGYFGYQYIGKGSLNTDTGTKQNVEDVSGQSLVSQVDFDLLENCPNDVNTTEGEKWLQEHGYEITSEITSHTINEGKTDWTISYPGGSASGIQLRYTITTQKCQDLASLYQQLEDWMKEDGFTEICASTSEEELSGGFGTSVLSVLSIWQSPKGTRYDLWSNGETLSLVREFDGEYFEGTSENYERQEYDLAQAKNQVKFDRLVNIDIREFLSNSDWFDQFRSEYDPEHEVVLGWMKDSVDVGFYYEASNKAEILKYLMDGLSDALQQAGSEGKIQCEVDSEELGTYRYYVDTGKSLISVESHSYNGTITMQIGGPTE